MTDTRAETYDAKAYDVCAPWFGERGDKFIRRFAPAFKHGLAGITDDYDNLEDHLMRRDIGSIDGDAHGGTPAAIAKSERAWKTRGGKLKSKICECVLIGGVGKYNAKSPFDPKRHCARPPAPTHPNAQPRHERHVQQRPHGLHLHCERTTSDVPHKRRGTSAQPPKRPIGRDEVAAAVRERPDHGPDRLRHSGTCTGWWGRCGIFLEISVSFRFIGLGCNLSFHRSCAFGGFIVWLALRFTML